MTDIAKIEADIEDAEACYREAFDANQFEIANTIQKRLLVLSQNRSRLADIERKVFI